jgi:hypothetical protein
MLLKLPENFSENGARPAQFLGRQGRLIGWARSFSDPMTVTDITIMGGCLIRQLTRIAGRDVSQSDGHTVGKTFSRKGLPEGSRQQDPARSLPAANRTTAPWSHPHQRVDSVPPGWHQMSCPQNGARETGLGQVRPGFLRSNLLSNSDFEPLTMPRKKLN